MNDISNSSVFISESSRYHYFNLLDYMERNINSCRELYTVPLLYKILKTNDNNELLKVIQYFSGGGSNLLNVKYCYEKDDGEYLNIPFEEYNNYILEGQIPVDENGREIDDFNSKYLSFYCLLNMSSIYEN
ncbi:hypothetical protein [Rahnella ecdela]|uniref:Uncharacterized protein n=1 Tax=Rahnella ecdela TaxID=2816250 RepID=A0ABS6LK00_9GAMM|nr:hypothetical protein [Rahnella ecdela]MBU9847140.1 hypothetical protein [Rahnella ecdela]